MISTRTQLFAISVLSAANIWLAWWDVRWLTYSQTLSRAIPGASPYSSLDPVLEAPGLVVLALAVYLLGYRSTYALWRQRHSNYRDDLMANALTINTVILLAVAGLGIVEWLILYDAIAPDLVAVVGVGAGAAIVSIYLERRPRWPTPVQHVGLQRSRSSRR